MVFLDYNTGSVFSDGFTYNKDFGFCTGFICFRLVPNNGSLPVTITNKMKIKRMEPYNDTDLIHLEEMLDNITGTTIDPVNIKNQILPSFNDLIPHALNDSLNHEIFGENIDYTWHSNTHGDMKMTLIHELQSFGINPDKGYKIIFVGKIKDFNVSTCDMTVPTTPANFE
jgi:hypothetical protein